MEYLWSALILVAVGGVAFRVWQFCGIILEDLKETQAIQRRKLEDQ